MQPTDRRPGVALLFDRAAPTYDQVGVDFFGPVAELLLGELQVRPGERVLDVGCGRGAVLLRAAPQVRPGGAVTGLDLSPAMVAATRQAASAAGAEADVVVGDAQAPDLPAGSYDVLAASLVLFFLPEPVGALRAWHELLAPGGRVGVTTFAGMSEAWRRLESTVMAHAPAGMRDPRLVGPASPFASAAGVERLVTEAGFEQVRTCTEVVPLRFDDEDHWYRFSWSVGQRGVWEALDGDARAALRARAYELLQDCRQQDGRFGVDQEIRVTVARRA